MTIKFIPNDPKAVATLPIRSVAPRPDRPANRARFEISGAVPEGEFNPGTQEFLYWQCREGVLAAVEAWEAIHGPFDSWQDDAVLNVLPDAGEDLNAYYDRVRNGEPERVSFFHQKVGTKTYFSGASTDVVAHEIGHALLDAIRPDFWTSFRFEVNSFHEAFGDCIALVTALHDKASRELILPALASTNPVESTAEELAEAIKKAFPGHNAGAARRARNNFQWGPQGSLPEDGGPGELIYEEHTFGQIFSGCFYDCIANIYNGMPQTEESLLQATQIAGRLLVKATQQAPQRSQYFREVGRLMILLDEQDNSSAHRSAIKDAFEGHGVALGAATTLAPQAAIAAAPAAASRRSAAASRIVKPISLAIGAKRKLLQLMGAETGKLSLSAVQVAGQAMQEAIHERLVPLDAIHKKLKGVVAGAAQIALVGRSHRALAVMGHISNATATIDDVEAYVASLVAHGRIKFELKSAKTTRGARSMMATRAAELPPDVTHEVREIKGQKTLVRVRFACGR